MNKIKVPANTVAKIRYLNSQDGKLMGWFEFSDDYGLELAEHEYEVYLALTGEELPEDYRYQCSHQLHEGGGYFLVHAYD
jgi:hypothetical protein